MSISRTWMLLKGKADVSTKNMTHMYWEDTLKRDVCKREGHLLGKPWKQLSEVQEGH